MSKRSKHQKVQAVVHDAEVQIPGLKPLLEQAEQTRSYANRVAELAAVVTRVDQGLPPYSPITQDEFVPTQVCTRREHELLRGRISNQRRELRNLNRAYRRRENENVRRITTLKEQVRLARKVIEQRNQKIEDQQRENDELRRQLTVAQNGGRRKRSVRWPRG